MVSPLNSRNPISGRRKTKQKISGGGGLSPLSINIPVDNVDYEDVFYFLGTQGYSLPYENVLTSNTNYSCKAIPPPLLDNTRKAELLFIRPTNWASNRNSFHSAQFQYNLIILLPSGVTLKPTDIIIQARTDDTVIHPSNVTLSGYSSNEFGSDVTPTNLATWNTGFTSGQTGQFNSQSISTSNYYTGFRLTRNSDTNSNGYFVLGALFLFGDLDIY